MSPKYRNHINPLNPRWILVRRMCIDRDKKCRLCGSIENLEAHHCSYNNLAAKNLRLELDDLTCLCRSCHAFYSKISKTRIVA